MFLEEIRHTKNIELPKGVSFHKDLLPTCTTKPKHVHVKLEFECVQKVNTKYKNI